MIILGIDPGIAIVGYGVIHYDGHKFTPIEYGAITTPAGQKLTDRIRDIYESVCTLIEKYKPDAFSIEELFFNTNVKTAISVAHGRGVCILAATVLNIPVFEYTPLQVKQAVAGYGRAQKGQVQRMVTSLLGLNAVPKPDDVADALAIAMCHGYSAQYHSRINQEGI